MANQNPEWSANVTKYFFQWVNTLHQNCKKEKRCICHEGAYRLAVSDLESIRRGKPDLDPDLYSSIMSRAFDIHQTVHLDKAGKIKEGYHVGSITPTWTETTPDNYKICNCFELAYEEFKSQIVYTPVKVEPTIVFVYDPYVDDRVI